MRIVCIIPARGGSKGVPGKNIMPINGIPLLAYSIQQAKDTPCINEIYVSTDDKAIAEVARKYGAQVIDRPTEISGDEATSESALLHALDKIGDPDLVVFLQATSPVRKPDDIYIAIDKFYEQHCDSMFSACRIEGFIWQDKVIVPSYDYQHRPRRQDLEKHYVEENGSIYLFKPWVLRHYHNRLGGKIGIYYMDKLSCSQIDYKNDIEPIERILRA